MGCAYVCGCLVLCEKMYEKEREPLRGWRYLQRLGIVSASLVAVSFFFGDFWFSVFFSCHFFRWCYFLLFIFCPFCVFHLFIYFYFFPSRRLHRRVFRSLELIDEGETDHKIIALRTTDPNAANINSMQVCMAQ